MGIEKIQEIKNLGIFENFSWPLEPPDLAFQKVNLLYGYNGSGKTTLSNVLSLYACDIDADTREQRLQAMLTAPKKQAVIKIECDAKTIEPTKEQKKLLVFNTHFVSDHVYDGSQSNVKPFKAEAVTKDQLSNPEIKKLSSDIERFEKVIAKAKDQKELLITLATEIRDELSQRWRDNIDTRNQMPQKLSLEHCPQHAPEETEKSLDDELEACFQKYKISRNEDALTQDINALENSRVSSLILPNEIEESLKTTVSKGAREKIKAKIDSNRDIDLKHASHQNWFEDGALLLKGQKSKGEEVCPLCDSHINNLEDLLADYDSYFNDELSKAIKAINELLQKLQKQKDQANQNSRSIAAIYAILTKYNFSETLDGQQREALTLLSASQIVQTISQIETAIQNKRDNIDATVLESEITNVQEKCNDVSIYNEQIKILVTIKDLLLEKLNSNRFDARHAREVCRNLFWKKFDNKGRVIAEAYRSENNLDKPELQGGIEFFWHLEKLLEENIKNKTKAEQDRDEKLAKLRNESKYINKFLQKLCVNNFTVSITGNEEGLQIIYTNGTSKNGLKHSLSEGEKTALAFAYFLSKYQYELIDNQNDNEGDYIVILDDPISSLDENRLYSTALVIRDYLVPRPKNKEQDDWDGCQQAFIFSHNLIFLKFVGNILEHKNKNRCDLYIDKGRLEKLPRNLDNYQTSYFYKLEKIHSYVDGSVSYEDIKDSLPNSIRIVLETFLSFKFGRLKGSKFQSPSLEELTAHLSGHSFANFNEVNDIKDQETLKNVLYRIAKVVNPESHGTTQRIEQIEYLPPTELKKIAQDTLDVVAFLDQMHFQAANNLAQIAA